MYNFSIAERERERERERMVGFREGMKEERESMWKCVACTCNKISTYLPNDKLKHSLNVLRYTHADTVGLDSS